MVLACVMLAMQVEAARLLFADRYDQAFLEAKARNVPVLVLDFDGWSSDRGDRIEFFYEDKEFLAATEGAVLVLASQDDHGEKAQRVDGAERMVCPVYGGISCRSHRDVLPKVFADFGREGQLVSPLFGVADPDHKELGRLEHEQRPAAVAQLLKEASRKLGPGLARGDYLRLQSGLQEIRRLADLHEFSLAVAISEELQKIPGAFTPQQELAAARLKLDQAGRSASQRAEELWNAGRHGDALLELDDVKASFGRFAVAGDAGSRLAAWEKLAEAKPFLGQLKAHRAARQLYLQGLEADRKGDPKRAVQALEKLIRSYPESRFAARARPLLAALKDRR